MVRRRLRLLIALITVPFLILLGRLWSLQGRGGAREAYLDLAARATTRRVFLPPLRGRILDRDGRVLAQNRARFDLFFVPAELDRREPVLRAIHAAIAAEQAEFPSLEDMDRFLVAEGRADLSRGASLGTAAASGAPEPPRWRNLVRDVPPGAARAIARVLERNRNCGFALRRRPAAGGDAFDVEFLPLVALHREIVLDQLAHALGPQAEPADLEEAVLRQTERLEQEVRKDVERYLRGGERRARDVRSVERTARKLLRRRQWPLLGDVSLDALTRIEYRPELYPGVFVRDSTQRQFPGAEATAAIVGHVLPLDRRPALFERARREGRLVDRFPPLGVEEFAQRREGALRSSDPVGVAGIEARYDAVLRGSYGVAFLRRTRGGEGVGSCLASLPERHGSDLQTTLDLELQRRVHERLRQACRPLGPSRAGSVVVLDVPSGAVRVSAGYPSFDPSRIDDAQYRQERQRQCPTVAWELDRPFLQAVYPGSIFKILTAIAALEERSASGARLDPSRTFPCHGRYNKWFKCHSSGHAGEVDIDLPHALTWSCNSYFYHLAEDWLDYAALRRWAAAFGFGSHPGVDLVPALDAGGALAQLARGRLDEPAAAAEGSPGKGWTCHLAIGQVHVQATPLQVARLLAAVALRGRFLPRPWIVEPQPPDPLPAVASSTWDAIWRGMRDGVRLPSGTAGKRDYGLYRFAVAAKTGTAQIVGSGPPYHAWLAGFGPLPRPSIVFVVLLEASPGYGGKTCAPVAEDLLEALAEEIPQLRVSSGAAAFRSGGSR